jgi:hypothetical protein
MTLDKEQWPGREELLSGGPFHGTTHTFNPADWEPDEVRYWNLKKGVIDDIVMFSRFCSEGARYTWNHYARRWDYLGAASRESQENSRELFDAFGISIPDWPP